MRLNNWAKHRASVKCRVWAVAACACPSWVLKPQFFVGAARCRSDAGLSTALRKTVATCFSKKIAARSDSIRHMVNLRFTIYAVPISRSVQLQQTFIVLAVPLSAEVLNVC